MRIVHIQGKNIFWKATYNPESKLYILECEAMNLILEAETYEEIPSLINEAMYLLLKSLLKDNELEHYLRDRDWQSADIPPSHMAQNVKFNVPWELLYSGGQNDPSQQYN